MKVKVFDESHEKDLENSINELNQMLDEIEENKTDIRQDQVTL